MQRSKKDKEKFIQTFSIKIRDDIKRVSIRESQVTIRTEIMLELNNKWSIGITNWSDGYTVIIYKPNCHILINKWPLSLKEAQKMVKEWELK